MNYQNPFPKDKDRNQLWEMLVERDIIAFCKQDWDMVANDFVEKNFMGIDAGGLHNPDSWQLGFPDLVSYKKVWLEQAAIFAEAAWAEDPEQALYKATNLRDIEIQGKSALLHKKFDGYIKKKDGTVDRLNWQTLYRCRKVGSKWKIVGFTGYMPFPMGFQTPSASNNTPTAGKYLPKGAEQHVTAGPYSPVLKVVPGEFVVISGQAAIDKSGKIIGDTIEAQTHETLKNCQAQLQQAGCDFKDVFKVNVFLTDLDNWPRFNEVYTTYFDIPKPVRTAVQTPLLMTLLVEIEMWAVK